MVNEVIGLTVQGTQLLINTYFGDLSDVEIPQKYYFEMCGKQGYFLTVINYLYKSSKAKTKRKSAMPFPSADGNYCKGLANTAITVVNCN